MSRNLRQSLSKSFKPNKKELMGLVGAVINGVQSIEVKGRDGFIYVRLRDNPSEFIQAYNEKIQNVYYDVPVVVIREGNRYIVLGKNSRRYSQWVNQDKSDGIGTNTNQLMTLRHGSTHSFDPSSSNGGGDIAWIYSRQFMPGLISPYNISSPNVYIAPVTIKNNAGSWKYVGNTGTVSIINYKPNTGTRMVLVSIDTLTGNPFLTVTSGTTIPEGLTGTSSYLQYMPSISNDYMPLSLIRLESGTTHIGWDNITDVREFGGGGSDLSINGTGSYSNINFPNFSVLASGSSAFVEYAGSNGAGGGDDSILFSVEGRLATGTNSANLYMITKDTTINQVYLYGKYLGVTGSTIVDVNLTRSGTTSTIYTTQANRPTLNYTDTDGWVFGTPNITSFGAGDVLSLDIDTVSTGSEDIVVAKLITGTSSSSSGISVEESDGSPSVTGVQKIKVAGGTVTNDGGGIVTVKSGLMKFSVATGSTDITTASGTFVDMADMSIAMTTGLSTLDISFDVGFGNGTDNGITTFRLVVDGSAVITNRGRTAASTIGGALSLHHVINVSAGSHTIKAQWSTSGGTSRNYVATTDACRVLIVKEFAR